MDLLQVLISGAVGFLIISWILLLAFSWLTEHGHLKRRSNQKRSRRRYERRNRDLLERGKATQLELTAERERLRGTGKVPYRDWETSVLATQQVRFRRPSAPRSRPTGWSVKWDEERLLLQEGCCFWCGQPLNGVSHRDHVVPLARGGANDISNLVMACPPCNLDKGAKDPLQWLSTTRRITPLRRVTILGIIPGYSGETTDQAGEHSMSESNTAEDPPLEFEIIQLHLFDNDVE